MLCFVAALVSACGGSPAAGNTGVGQSDPESTADLLSGCFELDPPDAARRISLCLGAPTLPPGRYTLRESETVPDATFSTSCEGSYGMNDDAIELRPERCDGHEVNEQLGEGHATGAQAPPEVRARARSTDVIAIKLRADARELTLARVP